MSGRKISSSCRSTSVDAPTALRPEVPRRGGAVMNRGLLVLLLLVAAGVAYRFHSPQQAAMEVEVARDVSKRRPPEIAGDMDSFSCEGKTRCRQMTSCAEAKFYLDHCP